MASKKRGSTNGQRRSPATSPDAREQQLISQAIDLAETQIADGSASAQVISHFLKMGSSRERVEQARLRSENELLQGRVQQLKAQVRMEDLYERALRAMSTYSGSDDFLELEESEYDD